MVLRLKSEVITIANGNTPTPIKSIVDFDVQSCLIVAHPSNVAEIYLGGDDVAQSGASEGVALAAGDAVSVDQPSESGRYDLSECYVNVASAGDKVQILYVLKEAAKVGL